MFRHFRQRIYSTGEAKTAKRPPVTKHGLPDDANSDLLAFARKQFGEEEGACNGPDKKEEFGISEENVKRWQKSSDDCDFLCDNNLASAILAVAQKGLTEYTDFTWANGKRKPWLFDLQVQLREDEQGVPLFVLRLPKKYLSKVLDLKWVKTWQLLKERSWYKRYGFSSLPGLNLILNGENSWRVDLDQPLQRTFQYALVAHHNTSRKRAKAWMLYLFDELQLQVSGAGTTNNPLKNFKGADMFSPTVVFRKTEKTEKIFGRNFQSQAWELLQAHQQVHWRFLYSMMGSYFLPMHYGNNPAWGDDDTSKRREDLQGVWRWERMWLGGGRDERTQKSQYNNPHYIDDADPTNNVDYAVTK